MKLRNKKTREIVDRVDITIREEGVVLNNDETYNSLTELNAEWEDASEEPKEYWYLSGVGEIVYMEDDGSKFDKDHKFIGNYFKTKEEAEKAVEKLKAWKRLKDKGFRFNGGDDACISYLLDPVKWDNELEKDFNLLFGGEE